MHKKISVILITKLGSKKQIQDPKLVISNETRIINMPASPTPKLYH